jgi:hypothetical protein
VIPIERDDGATVLVGHPNDAYEDPRKHAEQCAATAVAAGTRIISGLVRRSPDVTPRAGPPDCR